MRLRSRRLLSFCVSKKFVFCELLLLALVPVLLVVRLTVIGPVQVVTHYPENPAISDCLKSVQQEDQLCFPDKDLLTTKKFIYLTQTEQCISDYLKSARALGDPSECQCDVIVLSYKKPCDDTSLPHITYIFQPGTTWTSGRNLLYETVINRHVRYQYYTFLDDDLILSFQDWGRNWFENPWRDYEKSLLEASPLIGVLYDDNKEKQFLNYYLGSCVYPEGTNFLPYVGYDAMFNSFHWKVICHLLPYYTKQDRRNWWHSQLYNIIKTDFMFPGQVQYHLRVNAQNPLHRPYPRLRINSLIIRQAVENVKSEVPREYLKLLEPKIQDWIANGVTYISYTAEPKGCVQLAVPQNPVVPYGHLKCGSSISGA